VVCAITTGPAPSRPIAASKATLHELAAACGTIGNRANERAGADKKDFERFMASFLFASGSQLAPLKAPCALARIR
jgi:hypothetical protein